MLPSYFTPMSNSGNGSIDSYGISGIPKKRFYRVSKVPISCDVAQLKEMVVKVLKCEPNKVEVEDISNKKYNFYRVFKVMTEATYATTIECVNS